MLLLLALSFSPQQPVATAKPATPVRITLAPASAEAAGGPRWSPKGAAVPLTKDGEQLVGTFSLGPASLPPIAVRLARSAGAEHFDRLGLDRDRDGAIAETEWLTTTPKETRGKWWSSFTADVAIPIAAEDNAPASERPYAMSLWFVADPKEPEAKPALRWSRRGWQLGEAQLGGARVLVQSSEMHLDGVFDQRDAWALARTPESLAKAPTRSLEQHCWLDGIAYRVVAIDPHGRALSIESFDPGFTEAEELAKADVLKPDREAPRAAKPLAFGSDLAAALAVAKRDGKRVFVDFQTTWCGPCKTMDELVYTAAAVVSAAERAVCVKLDGDEQRELVKRYTITGYPTMLMLDGDGKELSRAVGYRSVQAMVEFLQKP